MEPQGGQTAEWVRIFWSGEGAEKAAVKLLADEEMAPGNIQALGERLTRD